MLEYLIGFIFVAIFLLTIALYNFTSKGRIEVEKRVNEVVGDRMPSVRELELKAPLYSRAFKPLKDKIVRLIAKRMPSEKETELSLKISRAGISDKIAPREFLVFKYLASVGITFLILMLAVLSSKSTIQLIFYGCTGLAIGWHLPDFYISRKITERKREVEKSLPNVLDLLTVSVEAGLGFDSALMKVVEKTKGVLSDEFLTMLQEIKMGKQRIEALRDMSKRADVDDLSTFTGSVILADQLGISIGNILRLQSEQMRQKQRQRAEEMAMKIPVKIVIPLVFFIFPAIFVVLLGPAVVEVSKTFLS